MAEPKKKSKKSKKEKESPNGNYKTLPDTAEPAKLFEHNTQPMEEQLYPDELEAFKKVKAMEIVQGRDYSDEFLVACLFSRKMDLKRTEKMIKSLVKWQKDNPRYASFPLFKQLTPKLFNLDYNFEIPGARSKEGYGIVYIWPARLVPSDFTHDQIMDYMIWAYGRGIYYEKMDYHRRGIIFIQDMTGVGWKHLDMKLQNKMMSALQNHFPMRLKKVIMYNPPMIYQALLTLARLFMKKKLIDRFELAYNNKDILKHVDKDQLHEHYGGDLKYSQTEWNKYVQEYVDKTEPK